MTDKEKAVIDAALAWHDINLKKPKGSRSASDLGFYVQDVWKAHQALTKAIVELDKEPK